MEPVCPLCNQFENIQLDCEKCNSCLTDLGRITDYLDDYSPYEDIYTTKLVDGLPNSVKNDQCLHLVICPNCRIKKVFPVAEIYV